MIRLLQREESYPWELLLDADPDRQLVENYLSKSIVFVKENSLGRIIGVAVLQEGSESDEIMNVAVAPDHQGKGIGGELLEAVFAFRQTSKPLIIKTGDLTSAALSLYKRKGFKEVGFIKDYFVDHYPEPIYENGQQLRNQVILARQAID